MFENHFVYFVRDKHRSVIRIGESKANGLDNRLLNWRKSGYEPMAIVRGTKDEEKKLHDYFEPHLEGRDKSTYYYERVEPYVTGLLDRHLATPIRAHADMLSKAPWEAWRPEAIDKPLVSGNQYFLFMSEEVRCLERDTWQTPQDIADVAREGLGGVIDLDPASCLEANLRIKAKAFYTEEVNGLNQIWGGRVFLNPPYGEGENAGPFLEKLIFEIEAGRVSECITLLNLQSWCSKWLPPLLEKYAVAHAIWGKRIDFIGPRAKSGSGAPRFTSAKNGSLFSYHGNNVERFMKVFKRHEAICLVPYR